MYRESSDFPAEVGPSRQTSLPLIAEDYFTGPGEFQGAGLGRAFDARRPRYYNIRVRKGTRLFFLFLLLPSLLGFIFGVSLPSLLEVPDVKDLETLNPRPETRLYADDGSLFSTLFVPKRIPISIKEMPSYLPKAFIAVEDVRFFQHSGIDIRGILRAAYRNISKRGLYEGGSTITQQLARNLFLTPKKTIKRKLEEMMLAIQIERAYSKEEILNYYLNLVYLGEGSYGVEAASRNYFDKSARDLTLEEAAMLAGLTRAPSSLSSFRYPARAKERRNLVLKKMYEAGFIDRRTYEKALRTPLKVASLRMTEDKTGYFADYVRQCVEDLLGKGPETWSQSYHIHTTLNLKMTEYALEAIKKGLEAFRRRHPERKELPQVVLIAIEVKTGAIKTLVGGSNFTVSPFNRALYAKRQPGSAFKPFVYMAALEKGLGPDHLLLDEPIRYVDPWTGTPWEPRNYKDEYFGYVTMRKALAYSLNAATIRLLQEVGPGDVVELARRMHIRSDLEPLLSLALGTKEVYPIDLAAAYLTFARGGTYVRPYLVRSIATADGQEIFSVEEDGEEDEKVLDKEKVSVLVSMMRDVVREGTARAASKLPFAIAGKTGTTDDFRDAWFVGFSPQLLCLVWIGYDNNMPLGPGESGAVAALPIWIEFMSKALPMYPNEDFHF